MALKIYNSLTKRKEEFKPIEDGHVRLYNCGPTVYDYFHIGNARNFITAEIVCRYLEYKGYEVTFVQNVTDIEDKIINRANELGVQASEVAEEFTKAYFEDLEKLRTRMPDISPKATEHIDDIVQFVQKLVEKGIAYEVDGDVYFEIAKFKDYGKLSGQKAEDTLAGARVEVDERKRHPADFDLWKKSKPGEPGWDSPWGRGRPGWHIECSVMSAKYLGETFDIHIGGNDLVFPHHENEIAQSEALTGKPLARYWIHNGMLQTSGGKMSKSLGNIKSVRELLEEYKDPDTIRYYLLSAHYRGPLELKDDSLDEARRALQRIRNCVDLMDRLGATQTEKPKVLTFEKGNSGVSPFEKADPRVPPFEKGGLGGISADQLTDAERELNDGIDSAFGEFEKAMDDDFNTSGAIGAIFELIASANRFAAEHEELSTQGRAVLRRVRSAVVDLCQVLGMQVVKEASPAEDESLVRDLIKLLIAVRQDAREKKDWNTADKVRDGLDSLGIKLEDTREGTIWKMER